MNATNIKKKLLIGAIILIVLAVLVFMILNLQKRGGIFPSSSAVIIETPARMDKKDREPFSLESFLKRYDG